MPNVAAKIALKNIERAALAQGLLPEVEYELTRDDFAIFNNDLKGGWSYEDIPYGQNSDASSISDILLATSKEDAEVDGSLHKKLIIMRDQLNILLNDLEKEDKE